MRFHIVENTMRNGVKGYRYVKSFKTYTGLEKWVARNGGPVWVVSDFHDTLQTNGAEVFGGIHASYWNTGGWGVATMPVMPLLK